ncbi:hypothetical protein B0I35DRAFT_91923 [Stachybotrys elegans]|uniref:Uncharacterized protein n=1 Tax=Stachybotrys elegans TaxID=80388 RepID=A0A8K0WMP6_9HYPO|nr:hypothetical protein B0I35DRAFT_91923 [Stachybotrys elegans]
MPASWFLLSPSPSARPRTSPRAPSLITNPVISMAHRQPYVAYVRDGPGDRRLSPSLSLPCCPCVKVSADRFTSRITATVTCQAKDPHPSPLLRELPFHDELGQDLRPVRGLQISMAWQRGRMRRGRGCLHSECPNSLLGALSHSFMFFPYFSFSFLFFFLSSPPSSRSRPTPANCAARWRWVSKQPTACNQLPCRLPAQRRIVMAASSLHEGGLPFPLFLPMSRPTPAAVERWVSMLSLTVFEVAFIHACTRCIHASMATPAAGHCR